MNQVISRAKQTILFLVGLAVALTPTSTLVAQVQSAAAIKAGLKASQGRVIVTMRRRGAAIMAQPGVPGVGAAELSAISGRLSSEGKLDQPKPLRLIGGVVADVTESQIDELLADPNVAQVELDVAMPLMEENTAGALRSFWEPNRTQSTPWGVDRVGAPAAWAIVGKGAGVKIAAMDSGGDADHPDLVYAGGYSAVNNGTSPADWDDDISSCNGHGTHVAGTIAARDNSIGVVGVAPEASLYAIKVFSDFGGSCAAWTSAQIAGLDWAVSQGIRIVSVSIGGSASNSAYNTAIVNAAAAGTYLVAASGNTAGSLLYPANFTSSIAIGALTSSNSVASYSSHGANLEFATPGSSILSTMPGGGYASKSGTSMATPHAAGVAALILAQNPSLSLAQLRQKLQDGALDVGSAGWDEYTGWGLLRADVSVGGGSPPPPPPVPLVLAVSPTSRSASAQQGTAAPKDSGTVTLTGDNSGSTSWSASKKQSWTTLTTSGGTGSGVVRWNRSTSGLAPGSYTDTITVTARGASGSPTKIIDHFTVTATPVPLVLAVSPTSRSATAQQGTSAPKDSATVTLTGDNSGSTSWSASKKHSWTTLTTASGTGSGMVRWNRSTSGLAPGSYTDTITVTASGASGSPTKIIDHFTVTATPVPLVLAVSPMSRSASAQQGTSAPKDSATVTLTGDNSGSTSWSVSKKQSWTTLTTSGGTGSGVVRWNRSTSGLAPGSYTDTITVTASGASGSPTKIIDHFTVTATPVPLVLAVSPTSRSASAQQGTSAPKDSATVTLTGDNSGSTSWSASKKQSWTTLITASGTGSGMVRWNRSTAGLAPGSYTDTITVTASGASGSPTKIIDHFTVTATPVPLVLAVSPTSRSASAQQGTSAPKDSATVTLTGDNSGSTSWSASKKQSWTTLTTASGTGSGVVRWNRSTAGLAPGSYTDTITVTASGASGSPTKIIDHFTVTEIPSIPITIAVSPNWRSLVREMGSINIVDSAEILIAGTGASSMNWRATSSQSWNTIQSGSGYGSGKVRWSRNLTGLSEGTHVDTITVTVGTLTATIIDSVMLSAPTNGNWRRLILASRGRKTRRHRMSSWMTSAEGDSVKIQQVESEDGRWSASTQASWITLATVGGEGVGHVRWQINGANLPAGEHVDSIIVTLNSDPSVRDVFVDTLQVIETVTPEPELAAGALFGTGGQLNVDQRNALDEMGNANGQFDLGDFLAWVTRSGVRLSSSVMAEVQAAIGRGDLTTVNEKPRARERQKE